MNRDQIAASAEQPDLLKEFFTDTKDKSAQYVNLNAEVSPAVLSGILGVNVQQIYQFRQDGKLPPNSDATLRDCVKTYINFYKTKSASKASSMGEAALIQKIQLDRAKTEQTWLAIKQSRGELVSTELLAEQFESHFIHMRMQLCAIARRRPDLEEDIDKILGEWSKLGRTMMSKSETELETFITTQMDQEVEVKSEEEKEADVAEMLNAKQ